MMMIWSAGVKMMDGRRLGTVGRVALPLVRLTSGLPVHAGQEKELMVAPAFNTKSAIV